MFKLAKLENIGNEKVDINLITLEEKKESHQSISFETLTFAISSDDYTFFFTLNCQLDKLLEIPLNETINFKDYVLESDYYLEVEGIADFDIKMDIKITRYLRNKFVIFLTFFTDYTKEQDDIHAGMIEFSFNLDDYLK